MQEPGSPTLPFPEFFPSQFKQEAQQGITSNSLAHQQTMVESLTSKFTPNDRYEDAPFAGLAFHQQGITSGPLTEPYATNGFDLSQAISSYHDQQPLFGESASDNQGTASSHLVYPFTMGELPLPHFARDYRDQQSLSAGPASRQQAIASSALAHTSAMSDLPLSKTKPTHRKQLSLPAVLPTQEELQELQEFQRFQHLQKLQQAQLGFPLGPLQEINFPCQVPNPADQASMSFSTTNKGKAKDHRNLEDYRKQVSPPEMLPSRQQFQLPQLSFPIYQPQRISSSSQGPGQASSSGQPATSSSTNNAQSEDETGLDTIRRNIDKLLEDRMPNDYEFGDLVYTESDDCSLIAKDNAEKTKEMLKPGHDLAAYLETYLNQRAESSAHAIRMGERLADYAIKPETYWQDNDIRVPVKKTREEVSYFLNCSIGHRYSFYTTHSSRIITNFLSL